ncbi:Transposase [Oopsacas minuta]|uniref:Transposase n=1 Tax=Oopsacas minuta TaxID=111878 RepID=A0AAV7JIU1_9METZ|nr:Transposase [Oopsacas minuta]
MALELKISRGSVQTIVKSDMGLFPYKKRKAHFISAQIREKRLARSKALLARLASFGLDETLFSDEKLFRVEQAYNRQNYRVLSSSPSSIPQEYRCVQRVQHPQSVMVWAGVSAKGRTPLVFIPPGVKINAVKYQELVLDPIVRGLGKTMFNNRPFYFSKTVRQPTQ